MSKKKTPAVSNQIVKESFIVRRELINRIRTYTKNYYFTYQELVEKCGLNYSMKIPQDRKNFGVVLGHLFREEAVANRPLLTSIIYVSGTYKQGKGFFNLMIAENIRNARRLQLKRISELKFRRKLEKEAIEFWADKINYSCYKKELKLI